MSGLHILEFAELYRISPKVEHLAKAGLWWLLTPRFVSRLSSDGAYFRFFRSNVAEIMRTCPGLAIINHAFAHGVCLAEAAKWYEAARLCRDVPANLRKGENPLKIVAYVEKAGTSFGQYGRYLELLSLNGRHLDEFGVRYPRDFHAAFNAEDEANGRRTRRENHRRDAARNRSIASLAADLAAISDREFGAMRVHFPVSEADLRREGNIMHNCIGGYGGRIASRSSICFFIRTADGGPVADVEMRDNKVVQCYAPMNCKPEQPVIELADTVAGLIKSRLKEVGQERNGKTAIKE